MSCVSGCLRHRASAAFSAELVGRARCLLHRGEGAAGRRRLGGHLATGPASLGPAPPGSWLRPSLLGAPSVWGPRP